MSKQRGSVRFGWATLLDSRQQFAHLKVWVLKKQPGLWTIWETLWRVWTVNIDWNLSAAVTASRRGHPGCLKDLNVPRSKQQQWRWTDGCLAPSAVSKLKWWSACLQQDGAAHTGCVENVWTVCKTKACAEHALTEERVTAAAGLCSHDSLQIPLTDQVPNGVKVSECITLNLHPSLSVTLCFSFFSSSTWIPVGYWSILHPL